MTGQQPSLRDRIAEALSDAGAFCGNCGFEPGETGCPDCIRVRAIYTDALLDVVQPELDRLRAELAEARGHAELFGRKLTDLLAARDTTS